MPAQKPLHPSKLYSMLRACPDARARASAVLDFLVTNTSARVGYVLLAHNGELVLGASSDQKELPASLMERARALWASDQASHSEADRTRTVDSRQLGASLVESQDWETADGERYVPRVLGVYRDSRWIPVGISVLCADAEGTRRVRHPHIEAICNALVDSGDIGAHPA
jgi:hypothetical protein